MDCDFFISEMAKQLDSTSQKMLKICQKLSYFIFSEKGISFRVMRIAKIGTK